MDDDSMIRPAPPDLQAHGRTLWEETLEEYGLDPVEIELLHQLCQTVDELALLKSDLAKMGSIVTGHAGQPRANPLLAAIAAHRKLADQLSIALALPLPSEAVGRRRSAQAKQAADSRWKRQRRHGQLGSVSHVRRDGA